MEGQDQKLQEMERQLDEMKQKLDQLERRKKRKPWKIILIVAGVILGVVAAAVIAAVALMSSDKESPALAQQFIQAVVDQDVQSAYELLYPGAIDQEEFEAIFRSMCQAWTELGGGEDFAMDRTSWSMRSRNGATQYNTEYRVTSGQAQFYFSMSRVERDGRAGLTSVYIA